MQNTFFIQLYILDISNNVFACLITLTLKQSSNDQSVAIEKVTHQYVPNSYHFAKQIVNSPLL